MEILSYMRGQNGQNHPLDASTGTAYQMSILIGITWGLSIFSIFTAQVGSEGIRRAITRTFLDCRNMTRVEHFFPKYKHTP